MNIDKLLVLIEDKSVTADDFNNLLESLPKSTVERVQRRVRVKPGNPLRPVDTNPVKKAEHSVSRTSDTDPTKTAHGRRSVAKRGAINKQKANRFKEAIEFLVNNNNRNIIECSEECKDPFVITTVINRLLGKPDTMFNKDWLYGLKTCLDKKKNSSTMN